MKIGEGFPNSMEESDNLLMLADMAKLEHEERPYWEFNTEVFNTDLYCSHVLLLAIYISSSRNCCALQISRFCGISLIPSVPVAITLTCAANPKSLLLHFSARIRSYKRDLLRLF